jgi:ATP-dependent protease ClpP protease subunit
MARQSEPKTVTLLDEIEKCEKEVVDSLTALPDKKTVRFLINSGGGSVYASLAIATVMKLKQLHGEAIVLADCSSSALLIFATCQTRKIAPHASLLFHRLRWSSEDQARLSGAKSWAAEFTRVAGVYEDWLVSHLGLPRRTIKTWIREERYVLADELIELGVAEPLEFPIDNVIEIATPARRKAPARRKTSERIRRAG